jgi:hypothetical protein
MFWWYEGVRIAAKLHSLPNWQKDTKITTSRKSRGENTLHCPNCGSERVKQDHWGRRIGGAVGAGLGIWGAIADGACAGGEAGACAGGLLGALSAATAGAMMGIRLGTLVDEKILHDSTCLDCEHSFQEEAA